MGPVLVVKAAARRHFSLRVFAFVSIFIDLESARSVLLSAYPTHGPLHSFIGATLAGVLAAVLSHSAFNALNALL